MLTRLAEKSGLQLRYLCDENPPNKSHWTYKVFILNVDPETKQPLENYKDYGYLKMHVKDNEENVAEGYADQLRHLPARQRKRFLDGDFSEETMGALWNEEIINRYRVNAAPQLREVVVAVDPAVTSKSTSDKTGIIVVGKGFDGRGYVLQDESGIYSPKEWADKVTKLYRDWEANYIVAESNQGGEMVKHTIKTSDPYVPVKLVHATKGKIIRAEPVSSLYEDGMVSHVGIYQDLEDEMVSFTGSSEEESPNRLDALVWGVNFLFPVKRDFDAFW
jgi:predicted phage terminase large subunit-like protein